MIKLNIETELRQKLAAAHHVIHYQGWDSLLATHLSARIPETNTLLLTPLNIPFEEVSASKLIKCDFDGNLIEDNGYKFLPQAINIHSEIYKANSSVMSTMHTHSICGVAVSTQKEGLQFIHQQAMRFYDDISYHDFHGLAVDNEGKQIVDSLGKKKVMILRNHGLLVTAESIEMALYLLYYLEISCDIQIKAMSLGGGNCVS